MTHYNDVTVRFNGEPLCTAESVTVSEAPEAREPLSPFHAPLRCTANLDAVAAMFDAVRLPPSQPRGYVTIPYGILGPIRLEGSVDLPSWQVTESGAKGAFQMAENELRRAVSTAVQRAICDPRERESVALRVRLQDGREVLRMADSIVGRWAGDRGRYHGERKQRKAMRRLLRAAGILGGGQ